MSLKKIMQWISYLKSAVSARNMLVQICLWVCLIIFLLTSFFLFYTIQAEIESLQQRVSAAYQSDLGKTASAVEETLQSLSEVMRQNIHHPQFISAMVVPGSDDYTRTSNITKQLASTCSTSPLVDKAIFYIPTDGTVYSSDRFFTPVAGSPSEALIQSYLSGELAFETVSKSDDMANTMIYMTQSSTILFQPFLPEPFHQIGVLIFFINQEYFNQAFFECRTAEFGELSVFCSDEDCCSCPMFSTDAPQMSHKEATLLLDKAGGGGEGPAGFRDGKAVYSYRSQATGWLYTCTVDDTQASLSAFSSKTMGIFLVWILFVSAIAIYAIARIYQPINQLVQTVRKNSLRTPGEPLQNEMAYIGYAYTSVREEKELAVETIALTRPLIVDHLFTNILMGREDSAEYVRETLERVYYSVPFDAHYAVLSILLVGDDETPPPEHEMNLYQLCLKNAVEQVLPLKVEWTLLRSLNNSISLVLAFPSDTEESALRETIATARSCMMKARLEPPCRILVGCGSCYRFATDLYFSYQEAQENLNRIFFYGKNAGQETDGDVSYDYSEETHSILLSVNQSQYNQAARKADQICKEIAAGQDVRNHYQALLSQLTVHLSALKLCGLDILLAKKYEVADQLMNAGSVSQMKQDMGDFFSWLFATLEQRSKTRRFQHIRFLQEYIGLNYSDRDLSLNSVADHAGISPSYVSRLFKEELNIAFIDYLNCVRVEKTKELLRTTKLPVQDIGYQVGFNTIQNFFRVFKKHTGTSPGSWRLSAERQDQSLPS